MELSIEFIAIIISTIVLIVLISILEVRHKNPKGQELKRLSSELRSHVKEFRGSSKKNNGYSRQIIEDDIVKIQRITEDYRAITDKTVKKSAVQSMKIFALNPSNKKTIKAIIWMIIIGIIFFINNFTILSVLVVALDLSLTFNLLFFILNGVASFLIGAIIGYLIVRTPRMKRDTSELTKGLSGSEISRLKKLSGLFVGAVTPNKIKNKFYDEGVSGKYIVLSIFSKLFLTGLVGYSLYFVYLSVMSTEHIAILEVVEIIQSAFLFLSLIYYIVTMRKYKDLKFEHFSFFFFSLSVVFIISTISLNWKLGYYIIIVSSFIFLGVAGLLLHRNNKVIRSNYFIVKNLATLSLATFLFVDVSLIVQYAVMADPNEVFVLSFELWIPLAFFILSMFSLLTFLRNADDNYEFAPIHENPKGFLLSLATLILSVLTTILTFSVLGWLSLMILFGSSTFQVIVYIFSSSEDFKELSKRIKKK